MKIIPFEPSHVIGLHIREGDSQVSKEILVHWAKENAKERFSFSAVNEKGALLLCGGLRDIWSVKDCGAMEAWAVFAKESKDCIITILRAMKKYLYRMIRDNNLFRVQARTTTENNITGKKLLSTLGFKFEGTLKRYEFDGSDSDMFSITREDVCPTFQV